jgi:Tfp pilus assembly protein PilN
MRWADINLVNWREQRVQRGTVRWILMSLSGLSIVFGLFAFQYDRLTVDILGAQQMVRWLAAEREKQLDQTRSLEAIELSQKALEEQLQRVESLQLLRTQWWRFTQELPLWMVDGLYLQSLHYRDRSVHGVGVATSTEAITNMLSRMEHSPLNLETHLHEMTPENLWFDEPYLRFRFSLVWQSSNAIPGVRESKQ